MFHKYNSATGILFIWLFSSQMTHTGSESQAPTDTHLWCQIDQSLIFQSKMQTDHQMEQLYTFPSVTH